MSQNWGLSMRENILDPSWRPHPRFDGLFAQMIRLAESGGAPWRGTLFRFAKPRYAAREDRLLGVGAKRFGGRWNPKGLAATYGATTRETALAETFGASQSYGLDPSELTPRTLFAFQAQLNRILDLTADHVLQQLKLSTEQLATAPWGSALRDKQESLTQAVGRAAFMVGFEGLLAPTRYAPDAPNVVVYPEAIGVPQRLKTIQPDELTAF